jgi:predicted phosphodiesterase
VRVAALYDVHGNLPALEAVLVEIEREGVDEVVAGGDVVWGPQQAECVTRLRAAGAHFLAGNCERIVLAPQSDTDRWCRAQLGDADRAFVGSWPATFELAVQGLGRVLFCHATPGDDEEIVTRITPNAAVVDAFRGVEADVVVCGHTHVQFDRRPAGAPRVVNAGSVGMPCEGASGAYWALLGPEVELRRTAYDIDDAVARLRSTGFPSFDDAFEEPLRGLVTADSATEYFESRRGS